MFKLKKKLRVILAFLIPLIFIGIIINNSTTILKLMYPLRFKDYVVKYSQQNEIDPYLVFAIIKAESSFNPKATSNKNAKGLMQITETTGKWGAEKLKMEGFFPEHLYDPEINIRIGSWYIKNLMREFDNDMKLAIAAYNGGSGNVTEWLKNSEYSRTGKSLDKIPFKETDRFVKRVINNFSVYKRLYEGS